MTNEITIVDLKKEIDKQVADQATINTLLATTFKGLSVENVKPAILEGRLRGFSFQDFLEKNIYAIPYGTKYSLVTSIDWARKIGMRSGVTGKSAPSFTTSADGKKVESCTVTVEKTTNGVVGKFTATVYFDEYTTGQNLWTKKPRTMIAKVAEMHALRMACPEELSQAYVEEERVSEVKNVPVIDISGFETKLREAKTLEELQTAWANMPYEAKQKLEAVKEEMKAKVNIPAVTKDDMPNFKTK